MRRWKVIKVYKVEAETKKGARLAIDQDATESHLTVVIVKEDDYGILDTLKRQVLG